VNLRKTASNAPQIVTAGLFVVFAIMASIVFSATPAKAQVFRLDLLKGSEVLVSRNVDLSGGGTTGAVTHVEGGLAVEIKDELVSCGVYLQKGANKNQRATSAMISILRTAPNIDMASVVTASGLLTKAPIPIEDQTASDSSTGTKSLTADAPKLDRSCTVSIQ